MFVYLIEALKVTLFFNYYIQNRRTTIMKILLATIPSDSHTWNLVYIQLLLEELGHQVMNLGACVPINLLEKTASEYQPDAIVISSINGHANIEGIDIAEAIHASKLLIKIPLFIGGKLGTEGDYQLTYVKKLLTAGFNGVFSGENAINYFKIAIHKLSETIIPKIKAVA